MQNRILKELKNKTYQQLEKEAGEKSGELARLSGELVTGRLKNVRLVKGARIHLARVKTLMRQIQMTEGAEKQI